MNKWITWGLTMGLTALVLLTPAILQIRPEQSLQPVGDIKREQVIAVNQLSLPILADTLRYYLESCYGKRYPSLQIEPGSTHWLVSWSRSANILMNQMGEGYDLERNAYVEAGLLLDTGERTQLTLPVITEEGVSYLSTPVMVLNELLRKVQGQ